MTPKQFETLEAIKQFKGHHGYPPSVRELAAMIKSHSTGEVVRLLKGLEERGQIRRLKGRSRAIEIVDKPSLQVEGLANCTLEQLIKEIRRRGLRVGRVHNVVENGVMKRKFQIVTEEEVHVD